MWITRKIIIFSFVIFLLIGNICHAQIVYDEMESDPNLQLKFTFTDDLLGTAIIDGNNTVLYSYKTTLELPDEFEIYDLRNSYSRSYVDLTGNTYLKSFAGVPQQYKDEYNNWYWVDYATTTLESLNKQLPDNQPLTKWQEFINFFGIYTAYTASSTFYPDEDTESTSVDGSIYNSNATWDSLHDASSGTHQDSSATANMHSGLNAGTYYLRRGLFLFDTSALPDDATINSATFNITPATNGSCSDSTGINIVNSFPASNTDLVDDDFNNVGDATDNPTTFSTTKNISTFVTDTELNYDLNANGLANISKTAVSKFGTRDTNDITDSTPTVFCTWSLNFAEQTGNTKDPNLIVYYTEATSSPPTATTTSISGSLPIYNDIGLITGYKEVYDVTYSTSSPKFIEKWIIHWPAMIIICILLFIVPLFSRIFLELIIWLRNK